MPNSAEIKQLLFY